jgi:hypothetical protein
MVDDHLKIRGSPGFYRPNVDERHISEGSVITDKISFKADIPAPIQIVKTQEDRS